MIGGYEEKMTGKEGLLNKHRDKFNQLIDEGDEALTNEIFIGWEKIQDEEGIDVPFNEENKKALLDDFTVMKAVIESYGQMVTGGAEKN